jgi:apolipoprotein N-acyltransferase
LKKLYLPILSGILYALAFPKYGLWPVAWISIVPLLFSLEYRRPGRAFLQGFIAGLVAWGGVVYWIAYVMDTYGGMDLFTASLLLLLLMAILALYFGAFAWAASYLLPKRSAFFILPGIWILLEMFRGTVVFSGFPWALLGHSQLPWSSFVQIAEIGGVHLISGIVLLGNVAVFKAARKEFVPAALTAAAIIVSVAFGQWRIGHDVYGEMPFRAAVAQANVRQDEKWLMEKAGETVDTYSVLTRQAISRGAELVVWPETACPFFLFRQWPETYQVLDLSKGNQVSILTGSPASENGRYYNRAWLLRGGKIMGYYDKVHLVPFGEYLPLANLLKPWFGSLTREVSDFSTGDRPRPIEDLGVMICFESIFPDISRDLCLQGATLLINTSNDAWFETWATPEQLLQITGFRAVETRRWIVRSVNHGISAMINPYGKTVERIGLLKVGMMVRDVAKNSVMTFYVKHGPIVPLIWGVLAALIGALTMRRTGANPIDP